MNGVSDAVNGANSNLSGISNFLGNMTGGNGGNMFSNFFSNLFSGNVSGMSMLGLVASAFLIFGRFGWMGKIAGVLLGMMMIGNNSSLHQALGGGQAQQKPQHSETWRRGRCFSHSPKLSMHQRKSVKSFTVPDSQKKSID